MRLVAAIIGTIIFFFIAPFTLAGVVPYAATGWQVKSPEFAWPAAQAAGTALAGLGALMLIDSFARFALKGLGTPAPVFPTKRLVVDGLFRYVRNPIYVGVVLGVLGQALMFASPTLLVYGLFLWLGFHAFVIAYEEPTLRESFGAEYEDFCRNVPRWIPRLTPWRGGAGSTT